MILSYLLSFAKIESGYSVFLTFLLLCGIGFIICQFLKAIPVLKTWGPQLSHRLACEENYSLLKTNILLALYKEILNWLMTSSSELRTSLMNSVTRNEIYIITLIKWKRMASYKLCPHGELQRNVWRVWLLNRGPQPRSSALVLRHVSRLSKIVRQPSKVNTPDRLENNTKYFS